MDGRREGGREEGKKRERETFLDVIVRGMFLLSYLTCWSFLSLPPSLAGGRVYKD